MHSTDKRKKRIKRRVLRRTAWRCVICLGGLLILLTAWKLTSFAVRHLFPEQKGEEVSENSEKIILEDTDESKTSVMASGTAKNILLVNKDHPLENTYRPKLQKISDYGVEVDSSIYGPLTEMLAAGEKEGLTFWIASGYRSMERQRELLDEDIEELMRRGYSVSEAYEEVVKETMPVGCSEHATGLAADIVAKDYQILDAKQADTDEIKWLQKNCSQYGFILRYPEGKEDITKVSYESWHFRYVGVDAAEQIMSQGITLEEYLEARTD